jgi:hypothetical protein
MDQLGNHILLRGNQPHTPQIPAPREASGEVGREGSRDGSREGSRI